MPPVASTAAGSPSDSHPESPQKGGVSSIAQFLKSRQRFGRTGVRETRLELHSELLRGTMHFVSFETRRIGGALQLARAHGLNKSMRSMCATGGGSLKFAPLVEQTLGVQLKPQDELDCLVRGMAFLLESVPMEAYTFESEERGSPEVPRVLLSTSTGRSSDTPQAAAGAAATRDGGEGIGGGGQGEQAKASGPYPYLLVNIGSGVSILLVESETSWRRVSGTSIGGGTFFGLANLITGLDSFEDMVTAAVEGHHANVDLTVGDIYGGDYGVVGLSAGTIASNFGKVLSVGVKAAARAADREKQQHKERRARE